VNAGIVYNANDTRSLSKVVLEASPDGSEDLPQYALRSTICHRDDLALAWTWEETCRSSEAASLATPSDPLSNGPLYQFIFGILDADAQVALDLILPGGSGCGAGAVSGSSGSGSAGPGAACLPPGGPLVPLQNQNPLGWITLADDCHLPLPVLWELIRPG